MCDNCNNDSFVDSIIVMAAYIGFIYLLFLYLPVLAYVDIIGITAIKIFMPESVFGIAIVIIVFAILPAYVILKFLVHIFSRLFITPIVRVLLLYAQGLFVIALVGNSEYGLLSEFILKFISWGFNEDMSSSANILIGVSIVLVILSLSIEYFNERKYL